MFPVPKVNVFTQLLPALAGSRQWNATPLSPNGRNSEIDTPESATTSVEMGDGDSVKRISVIDDDAKRKNEFFSDF